MFRSALLAAALTFGIAAPAAAHHSTAMFDTESVVTHTGVVVDWIFTNPHTWLIVDVTNEDGTVTRWGFEGEGPGLLSLSGIFADSITVGETVTVSGNPMRDGRPAAVWTKLVKEDGTELYPRGRNPLDARVE